MQFKKIEDDLETTGLFSRIESENGLIRIGVYKVIFGYRVRAGFSEDQLQVKLDWCAGDKWDDVERLYSLAYFILRKREENLDCFDGLPLVSKVKPFYNDIDFTQTVCDLAGEDFELIKLQKPNLF